VAAVPKVPQHKLKKNYSRLQNGSTHTHIDIWDYLPRFSGIFLQNLLKHWTLRYSHSFLFLSCFQLLFFLPFTWLSLCYFLVLSFSRLSYFPADLFLHSILVNFSLLNNYSFPSNVILYSFLFWMFSVSLPFFLYVSTQIAAWRTATLWAGTKSAVCDHEQCTPDRHRCGLKLSNTVSVCCEGFRFVRLYTWVFCVPTGFLHHAAPTSSPFHPECFRWHVYSSAQRHHSEVPTRVSVALLNYFLM
jgi:hypothetical protein